MSHIPGNCRNVQYIVTYVTIEYFYVTSFQQKLQNVGNESTKSPVCTFFQFLCHHVFNIVDAEV